MYSSIKNIDLDLDLNLERNMGGSERERERERERGGEEKKKEKNFISTLKSINFTIVFQKIQANYVHTSAFLYFLYTVYMLINKEISTCLTMTYNINC